MKGVPVTLDNRPVPAAFAGKRSGMLDAARAGVQSSFAVVGYKGRNWRIKYRGDETLLREGGRPVPDIEVVIVGVAPAVSKTYYAKAYSDGDDNAPDCFSLDGVAPDASAPKKQSPVCGTCPHNQWGSRITENGRRAKACSDSRRIAVVPRIDIANATLGGPMLLRIPPTSLPNLASYADFLTRKGADVPWVGTKLGFDYDVAYPKLTFEATGFLTDEEAAQVVSAMENPLIERMLYDAGPIEQAPAATGADEIPGKPPAAMKGNVTPLRQGAGLAAGTPQTPVEEPGQAPPVEEPEEEEEPPPPAAAQAIGSGRPNPFAAATQQAAAPKTNGTVAPKRRVASATTQPAAAPPDLESAIDDLLADL